MPTFAKHISNEQTERWNSDILRCWNSFLFCPFETKQLNRNNFAEAADKGDLSENSEYDAAKEAQAHLEAKINNIKLTIAQAKIVDTSRLSTEEVQIMSKVEMTNLATKKKMTYTIVSESEADLKKGKISIHTPIAQGLLNKKVGDVAEIKIPRGTIRLKIDKISIGE